MTKIKTVFIFCLLIFLLNPITILAGSKSVILEMTIIGQPKDFLSQDLIDEVIEMISKGELEDFTVKPAIINEESLDGVNVTSTASGSLQNFIILSIF